MAGLRQGEALGLKWSDMDLDTGTLRVERQLQRRRGEDGQPGRLEFSEPKNASRRTVGLPLRAVRTLRDHRKRQLEEKLAAGPLYEDGGLVFASRVGKPLDAQNVVNRHFKPLLRRAGLPPIRFHDLRHSCLSLLAQRGEPIRDLQALAGHATAAFTLQRYTHHYDASARRTADAMGEILPDEP
jgi:integrase